MSLYVAASPQSSSDDYEQFNADDCESSPSNYQASANVPVNSQLGIS